MTSAPTVIDPIIYTCPMHPQVQEQSPGKCPKCGMDLVPKGRARNEESPVAAQPGVCDPLPTKNAKGESVNPACPEGYPDRQPTEPPAEKPEQRPH
jgi:hypothetical protein